AQNAQHNMAADAATKAPDTAKQNPAPPGSKTITIIDGSSGTRQEVTVPGNHDSAASKPLLDPKLIEATRHGAIPKIGPDGSRPSARYAQPRELPPGVTFALEPYGADLEKLAERARANKHELLLQVPMEPYDYPDNDPGPQTLLTSLTSEQNIDRLHWLMSRFQGYVGLMSYMGARFTAAEQSLAPVLREAAKRGLIYVDDGSSSRSIASQLAGTQNLPFARADIVLDAVPTPAEIDHALARLEMKARDGGTAVGFATAQPATIARIAEWAKKAEARGLILVPITMVAIKAKSSQ